MKNIDPSQGLTLAMVNSRKQENKVNFDTTVKSKSIGAIIRANLFTLFNLINFFLAAILVLVNSYENTVFIFVALANLIIGIVNEIRAKLIVDKLSLLVASKAVVIREGNISEIDITEIVLDDVILYETGNQVVVDSIVLEGEIEVNQSFITGEENPVYKKEGDTILSGSFIISGACTCQVTAVGEDNYTSKISTGAKYLKDTNSEILIALRKIIKIVTLIIIPFGLITFFKNFGLDHVTMKEAVIGTVAALDGMIPNGLILLTSTVMAVGVIRLYRYRVLVQELYSIENLARIDVLCVDKTGTLTEGKMEVYEYIPYEKHTKEEIKEIITNICAYAKDRNATSIALHNEFKGSSTWKKKHLIPFSSKRKYSGASFEEKGTYLIGAPEFLLKSQYEKNIKLLEQYEDKYRVLVLMHSELFLPTNEVPTDMEIIGFVLLQDKIRPEAKNTLSYFREEEVKVNIISGDSITTITNIAERLELEDIRPIDMTNVDNNEIGDIALKYNIFGRTSPEQKKAIILKLQNHGHSVAMIGDGVNDVLALKEADCSIAMASGSDAARNVSQLILLNSNFDSIPKVLLEGRRSINNIEKTSALFLTKTMYSIAIVLIFLFLPFAYPFTPLQLTLLSTLTIGLPSLYLGLEPNSELVKKGFLRNVFKKTLPGSVTMTFYVVAVAATIWFIGGSDDVLAKLCILAAALVGFLLLHMVSKPLNFGRLTLLATMIATFVILVIFAPGVLAIETLDYSMAIYYLISFVAITIVFMGIEKFVKAKM